MMIAAAVGVTMIVVAVEMAMVDVVAEAVTMTADVIKALYPSRCEVCM